MKKSFRLVLLVCAGFVGLAFAGSALAAYGPTLTIEQTSYNPGAATTVDVFVFVPAADDATARLVIYSPGGYTANLTAAPGTKIGKVAAAVKANQLGGAVVPLTGDVLVANPADPTIQAIAAQCTPGAANKTVWELHTTVAGQTLDIPVFVNTVGPYVTQTVCFPPPPTAPEGAQLVAADFTVSNVFMNAGARGGYEWASLFTPFLANGTPNPAGTTEWRTYVGLPSSLTLEHVKTKSGVKLAGKLSVAGLSPKGVQLNLYAGKKALPAPSATSATGTGKRVAKAAKLPTSGAYSVRRPAVKFATFFQARFEGYETGCTTTLPGLPAVHCGGESLAALTSNQVEVAKPRRKKH